MNQHPGLGSLNMVEIGLMIDDLVKEVKDTFLDEVKVILVKKSPLESYVRYCEYLLEIANLEHQKEVIHSEKVLG